jgi:hypothetical protein
VFRPAALSYVCEVRTFAATALVVGVAGIGTIASVAAGCSSELTIKREDDGADASSDGAPTDGMANADADTFPDGAPKGDAADAGDPADAGNCKRTDCAPGGCDAEKCQPFVVTTRSGEVLVGVAATDDRVFFTSLTAAAIRVFMNGVDTPVSTGENKIGSIKVIGTSSIGWSRGAPNADLKSGIFAASFFGTARTILTDADFPGCGSFAIAGADTHFCAIRGTGTIKRQLGSGTVTDFATNADDSTFMAVATPPLVNPLLVWSSPTGIRTSDATQTSSTGGALLLAGVTPVGIAVQGTLVYFTQTNGNVDRVSLSGIHENLYAGPLGAVGTFDITVTPDGKRVYWVQGSTIMGLVVALAPE